ncbi:MAG TPA: recombinase family protein [Conexibacter sp.]
MSRVGDRDGKRGRGRQRRAEAVDRLVSPIDQRQRIEAACEMKGLALVGWETELNVTAGAPLAKRPGLLRAIEQVEAGKADVIAVAYFDRAFRRLRVQGEVIERVEEAGGKVLTADMGEVGEDTAAKWMESTVHGMFAEYTRRKGRETSMAGQRLAFEEGRAPVILIPGLMRDQAGKPVIDHSKAEAVREACRMRADSETIAAVREHLRDNGIERSYHGVQSLLESRQLYGEVVFGDQRMSVPALIDRALWEQVQKVRVPRGRRPASDRLLARLGVLVCGTCGARMVVASSNNGQYPMYRCPPVGDCPRRVSISAELVEEIVIDIAKKLLADSSVSVSAGEEERAALARRDRAQHDLDAAIRAFSGVGDEPAAKERLDELRAARDAAQAECDQLAAVQQVALTLTFADWDELTRDEQREVISAVIERVTVAPGRGASRVTVVGALTLPPEPQR